MKSSTLKNPNTPEVSNRTLTHPPAEVYGTTLVECIIKMHDDEFITYEEAKIYARTHKAEIHAKDTAHIFKIILEKDYIRNQKVFTRKLKRYLIMHPNPNDGRKIEEHFFILKSKDTSHDRRHYYLIRPVW